MNWRICGPISYCFNSGSTSSRKCRLRRAPPPGTAGGGATQGLGYKAAPGAPTLGGSFPRSFLIPGTDTSIRVGGFVDFTALDFLNGGGNVDGSNYGSNSGQNGTLSGLPLAGGFVPGHRLRQSQCGCPSAVAQ